LTEKDMEGHNMEGAKYVCSPPPRDVSRVGSQIAMSASEPIAIVPFRG
jgi:hypothetical protein